MAKGRKSPRAFFPEPEPDPRPFGFVQFADPSTARMAARANTFNEPPSNCHGQTTGMQPRFSDQAPFVQKHDGHAAWEHMRRLRGVEEKDEKA